MSSLMSKETSSFPAQRRTHILELLKERGAASIQELADEVGVSNATIRRDLDYLAEHDLIAREHGGAILEQPHRTAFEPDYSIGSEVAKAEKRAIGRLAAQRLSKGQSVIFDSSSTVLEAARAIVARDLPITAVTNDLNIAMTLAQARVVQVVVPGGSLRTGSFTLVGDPGRNFLAGLRVDVALIGVHALVDAQLSETSIEIAGLKRQMIASAHSAIVLADATKFATPAFCRVAAAQEVQEIISDTRLSREQCEKLEAQGVRVTLASPEDA